MSVARGGTGAILRARHRQEIRVSIASLSIQIFPYFFGHLYSVLIFFTFFPIFMDFLDSMHAHFAINPKSSPLVLEQHFTTRCCSLSPSEQIHQAAYRCAAGKEPVKCYVTPMGWGVSNFPGKSVTKVYGSTLLAFRGGGCGSNSQEKKRYVTLEWPLR